MTRFCRKKRRISVDFVRRYGYNNLYAGRKKRCDLLFRPQSQGGRTMNGNPLINETLLQMKYARVISLLAKKLAVPEDKAMAVFYNSKTYCNLNDLRNGLQNMSDAFLVDEIIQESSASWHKA